MKIGITGVLPIVVLFAVVSACQRHELSPEQAASLQSLKTSADELQKEIAAGEVEQAKYEGGLLKLLIAARLEISKTTLALIQQRMQAVEAGSPVTLTTLATTPDTKRAELLEGEIAAEQAKLDAAEKEAAKYSGGLIQVMALSTAATERQTLAMLRQQMLIAKLGLSVPKTDIPVATRQGSAGSVAPEAVTPPVGKPPATSNPTKNVADEIILVVLTKKSAMKPNYEDLELLDVQFTASGLDKKARAIKGVINFADLFDEPKFHLNWSIDKPISPGEVREEKGGGFKYNQFNDAQQWVRNTDISDMKVSFTVKSILYEDGTRRDLE